MPGWFEKAIPISVKRVSTIRFAISLSLVVAGVLHASSTNLLPGITFYDGSEKLTGKLVFILQHDKPKGEFDQTENNLTAASIYEFDLAQKKSQKVTDSPFGQISVSPDGNLFCVIYWLGNWGNGNDRLAFVYSKPLRQIQTLNLDSPPKKTTIVGGHVFFEMEDSSGSRILNFDFARNKLSPLALPDASKWPREEFDKTHVPSTQTNILHFSYNPISDSERKVKEGKDYADGVYSLDVQTGSIKWISSDFICKDDEGYIPKAFDGRYILFEGRDAPSEGFKLVSSPWEDNDIEDHSSAEREKNIKFLHSFSMLGAIVNGGVEYTLKQMSPDHHYALVSSGTGHTYYLVDVSTGKTRVLLDVNTEAKATSCIWNNDVHWVGATQ